MAGKSKGVPVTDEKLTYSISEAARALGLSQWTVKRLIADGLLPLVPHTGRRRLISRKRLAEWVENREAS